MNILNKKILIVFIIFMSISLFSQEKSVHFFYLGVKNYNVPSITKKIDNMLYNTLVNMQNISLVSQRDRNLLIQRLEFTKKKYLGKKELLKAIEDFDADNVIVAWCNVKKLDIKPVRKFAIIGKIEGDIAVDLYVLSFARYGKINFSVFSLDKNWEKFKSLAFIGNIKRYVDIEAEDRISIINKLITMIVKDFKNIISVVADSNNLIESVGAKKEKSTVNDIFNIPAMETQNVKPVNNSKLNSDTNDNINK